MPSAARVAANARSHSPSGPTSVSSGPSSARRSRTSPSALRHELGVLAKPEPILTFVEAHEVEGERDRLADQADLDVAPAATRRNEPGGHPRLAPRALDPRRPPAPLRRRSFVTHLTGVRV
jgi:hypothetical protein